MAYLIRGFALQSLILEELNEGEGGRAATNHGFLESQNGRVPSLDLLCSTTLSPQHYHIACHHFPHPRFQPNIVFLHIYFLRSSTAARIVHIYLFCSYFYLILCICISTRFLSHLFNQRYLMFFPPDRNVIRKRGP